MKWENVMTAPTELGKLMTGDITNAIKERFNLDGVIGIEVKSIEVDVAERKIMIKVEITTEERPEALAKSYFGLTRKVRETLGSDWAEFFPVINPQFSAGVHA